MTLSGITKASYKAILIILQIPVLSAKLLSSKTTYVKPAVLELKHAVVCES